MSRFDKFKSSDILKPYIRYYVISESEIEHTYKVLPDTSLVMGLQYRGHLFTVVNGTENPLSAMGVTGLQDNYRIFKNTADIGTVLIYFTETGASSFFTNPVNELFSESLPLDHFFSQSVLAQIEEQLSEAQTDAQRIQIVELFLISHLRVATPDLLVTSAIAILRQTKGIIRMKDLTMRLNSSQSPFEKRFRKIVGSSPKKFASIIRLQTLIYEFTANKNLTDIGYESGYYDQAHFIKDFKTFTGETPEKFFKK